MSSKKNRNRHQQHNSQKTAPAAPAPAPSPSTVAGPSDSPATESPASAGEIRTESDAVQAISVVHGQSIETATEADIEAATGAPAPVAGAIDLVKAARELWEAHALCRARALRLARLEEGEANVQAGRDSLAKDREGLDSDRKTLESYRLEVEALAKDVEAREASLRIATLNAEAGFAKERRESLKLLEDEAEALRKAMSAGRKQIADEQAQWDETWRSKEESNRAQLEKLRQLFAVECEEARKKLEEERRQQESELSDKRAAIKKELASIQVREDILREDREAFDAKVVQRAGAALEQANARIRDLEARVDAVRGERDDLYGKLRERDEAVRAIGNKPLSEVKQEMDALRKENKALQDRVSKQPSLSAVERLQELERAQEEWESDRARLSQDLLACRAQLGRSSIAVNELETLRDQKAALESSRGLLQASLKELRKDVDERIKRTDGVSPFPSCSQMDANSELQSTVPLVEQVDNLLELCTELQQRVARDPSTGKELYYSIGDIRCFLAGMASSRLHLLQGISGTGKTSLPLAFARALGAGSALIEVQAGWRDRQDLIGHFNAFERRFYESEFLQALYRAQCPRFAEVPFIVVLDEMNLSHPEQYFADLLSALEQDVKFQKLDLMTAAVDPAPALLKGGRTLAIPQNVWFVGTANHDETTKDFAPKTYDRAHVMELPRHRESFKPKKLRARPPLALAGIRAAFSAAQDMHQRKAAEAYQFLDSSFAEVLGTRFGVGWGNRLERQMMDFVPVVLAAGGNLAEAVDHILATKLLRRIRDRHDTKPEDLVALRTVMTEAWPKLRCDDGPVKSMDILRAELRRLGSDDAA